MAAAKKFRGSSVQNAQADSWYNQGQMTSDPNAHKIFHSYQTIYDPDKFHGRFYQHPWRPHSNASERRRDAR